jgi:uncharacterized membrane protein SpoIIM required for sporulation
VIGLGEVREDAFVARRQAEWTELDRLLARVNATGDLRTLAPQEIARLAPLYRDLCADLARAEAARYGAPLLEYLHGLTASAHGLLYAAPPRAASAFRVRAGAWVSAFPRAFRAHGGAMALSAAFFFVPFAIAFVAARLHPEVAFRVVPEAMLRPLTESYAKGFAEGRDAGQGMMMAGFYIWNNVGIALRCFAMGIFGGLGSAFYLVTNGLMTGAIVGYVASQGAGANVFTFVTGHSTFELGAIVIAGGAGLMLGWAAVAPGERTRVASLQAAGKDAVVLVSGAAVMLCVAAGIEAYWSPSSIPSGIKRAVGLGLFVLLGLAMMILGRGEKEDAR